MVFEEGALAVLGITPGMLIGFYILLVWTIIWEGIALWKSGRNNQIVWFVVMFILNTAGILPIIYLLFFQKKTFMQKVNEKVKKISKKR